MLTQLKLRLFGISPDETSFKKRGFYEKDPATRQRLEQVGQTFVQGYHLALEEDNLTILTDRLNNEVEPAMQGFAFEGAGMGLTLLDYLTPWRTNRLKTFLKTGGNPHYYMILIGAGWAVARLRRSVKSFFRKHPSIFQWLMLDGYGFHQGYFHPQTYITHRAIPKNIKGYTLQAFDQGLGRCLWFVAGADIDRIGQILATFPSLRRADIWSGIGLACTYAGGVTAAEIEHLRDIAGTFYPNLAQGATFAVLARSRANNVVPHTELVTTILCDTSAHELNALALNFLDTLETVSTNKHQPAYEVLRLRLQTHFASRNAISPSSKPPLPQPVLHDQQSDKSSP